MNTEKFNYYWWQNQFTSSQVKQLISSIEKNNHGDEPDSFHNTSSKNIKTKKLIYLSKLEELSFFKQAIRNILEVNNSYFGYDLFDTYRNLGIYQCYDSKFNNEYKWHSDISAKQLIDIKLTVVINLSTKEYTGGDFEIHLAGGQTIKQINGSGNMIMFKSILPHRVLPIIKGERKTLTIFLEGPNFR